jgi:hypothetical protein
MQHRWQLRRSARGPMRESTKHAAIAYYKLWMGRDEVAPPSRQLAEGTAEAVGGIRPCQYGNFYAKHYRKRWEHQA